MQFTSFIRTAATTFTLSLACLLPAQAALEARDIGHTGTTNAFYDTTLNVTWLDMNSGPLGYTQAHLWASGLNVGGVTGWRLPTMTIANPGTNFSYNGSTPHGYNVLGSTSEMASLFFDTLGNRSSYDTNGAARIGGGLTNTGSFQNLQSTEYWIASDYSAYLYGVWAFATNDGSQFGINPGNQSYALALHNGDVAPVPEPETYAMLLAGLGLIGAAVRRRRSPTSSGALQQQS